MERFLDRGSPLGSVLAGVFISTLRDGLQTELYSILLFRWHVGGTLKTLMEEANVKELLGELRSLHPRVDFIVEYEGDAKLSLLIQLPG